MSTSSIGVAVIGAGMAGRAHAAGYRSATTVFNTDLPEVRLVAIADAHEPFAADAAKRYGYERVETDWRAIAEADDIDAVSIVVANSLHREIAEALLASGKHVLCEKPMAPTLTDARAMVDAAEGSGLVASLGFTFHRSPAINAIRQQIADGGGLGQVTHFTGHYYADYGFDPDAPISWRYRGGLGSGALADIGSHLIDVGEFLAGPVESVRGSVLSTVTPTRPVPIGTAVGHAKTEVSDVREPVENEDVATFTATFASGAVGTFTVSRVAFGHANTLGFRVFCEHGSAAFDLDRPAEFTIADTAPDSAVNGYRRVAASPDHPYLTRGLPMDFPSVGYGQNDLFVFQARAFLEQVAGLDRLPPCPSFAHGLHNLRVLSAVVDAADADGKSVTV